MAGLNRHLFCSDREQQSIFVLFSSEAKGFGNRLSTKAGSHAGKPCAERALLFSRYISS
jgi:hypothetical protein